MGDRFFPYDADKFGRGANMAVRRDLALALEGFDEALDAGRKLPRDGNIDMMHRVVHHGHPHMYTVDPYGRRQLRRLVRWFFALRGRSALLGAARRDGEQWRARWPAPSRVGQP